MGTFPVISIVSLICITKTNKIHISIFSISNSIIYFSIHIKNYSFHYNQMVLLFVGLISCTDSNTVTNVRMIGLRRRILPIKLLYNVISILRPFSSFVNLTFVSMGVLMCLAISRPNFFTRSMTYFLWDMKISCFSCFTQ